MTLPAGIGLQFVRAAHYKLWKPSSAAALRSIGRRKFLSTSSEESKPWYYDNPSFIVDGVTTEDLERDAELADFFAANFTEPPPTVQSLNKKKAEKSKQKQLEAMDPLAALNIRRMQCFLRDSVSEDGSRACRSMRVKQKIIPGVIYGGDKSLNISSNGHDSRIFVKTPLPEVQREMDRYNINIVSRVYELTVMDQESGDVLSQHRVIPRDVQLHPVLNKPYCINYMRYYPGRNLKIPIRYINQEESPGLKRGGYIIPINRHLECTVEDGVPIPESIDLDCTGVRVKDKLRLERLIIPDGVLVSKNVNQKTFLVGPVFGRGIKEEAETIAAEES